MSERVMEALAYAVHSVFRGSLEIPNSAIRRMRSTKIQALLQDDTYTFTAVKTPDVSSVEAAPVDAEGLHHSWCLVALGYVIERMPGQVLCLTEAQLRAAADVAVVSFTIVQAVLAVTTEVAKIPIFKRGAIRPCVREPLGGFHVLHGGDHKPDGFLH